MYIYQIMSNEFGYLDIILLAMIAGFIILRLRNILGRRTGHQDKVYGGFSEKDFDKFKEKIKSKTKKPQTEFDKEQRKEFLKGAEIAYETIINSFAKGDKKSLKDLLTKEMRQNFESAIEPANCAFVIPLDLIVTAPELTLKSSELNDATPLLDVVASSPAIVIVVPDAEVSIPSPPDTVSVSEPKSISIVPLSVVASKSLT